MADTTLTPARLRAALDTAGIGHTIVRSLGHPDRWVTACAVSVEDFAGVVYKDARAEVEPLIRHLLSAHDDLNSTLRDDRLTHAADQLRAWLNKEAPHGTPA